MSDDDQLVMLAGNFGDENTPAHAGGADSFPTSRMHGESGAAFAAFKQWLAMDTGSRSYVGVAAELGKSATLINRWAGRWRWKAPLVTHEDEQAAIRREAEVKAAHEHAKLREARRAEVEELQYLAGRELVAKAREIVAGVGLSTRPADAARLAAVGVQLLRLAVGLPTNKAEITGKDDSPLTPSSFAAPVCNIYVDGDPPEDELPPEGEVEEESYGV